MLPCVESAEPGGPLMGGGIDFAWITGREGRTIGLTRYAQPPRADAYWFRAPNDPIQPPLTLDFYDSPNPDIGGISRQGYYAAVACFQSVYPPR